MIEPYFSVMLTLIVSVTWGINSHILKVGMVKQNPFLAIAIRSAFAFPFLIIVVIIWKGLEGVTIYFESTVLPLVIASSVLIIIGDGMFLYGIRKYPVNVLLPISSVFPLFTTIAVMITGTEAVTFLIIVGTIIIIFGVILVTRGNEIIPFEKDSLVYGLFTAFGWGTSIFFIRKVFEVEGTEAFGFLGVRTFLVGIEALFIYLLTKSSLDNDIELDEAERKKSIVYLGLSAFLSDVLAAGIFFSVIQRIGTAIPTPVSSTSPIAASIFGYIYGIESLSKKQFLGILICVIGTIIILIK